MRQRHKRYLGIVLVLLLCLSLAAVCRAEDNGSIRYLTKDDPRPALGVDGQLEIHVINAAAGDSILLRFGGETMLVDSSIYSRAGRVIAYLQRQGIARLDRAFMTHPHDDHLGGFRAILAEIPADVFLRPALYDDFKSDGARKLAEALEALEIPVETVLSDTRMMLGGATLTFYQWENPKSSINDRSMLILARYGERTMLLAADLETPGQSQIAELYGSLLAADVVKIPHHGVSSYRKVLREAVGAELAVFTNSPTNIQNAIDSVKRSGAEMMFQSRGSVVLVTDGATWVVWQEDDR